MSYWIQVAISLVLSTLEISTILILTFVLFRFKLKRYLMSMLLIGTVLSYCSYEIREGFQLPLLVDTGFQVVALYLTFRFIYRVGYFYSFAMTAKGVALYMVINYAVSKIILFSIQDSASALHMSSYILQFSTILCGLIIAYLMRRFNIGVSYVPFSHKERVIYKGVNTHILVTGLFATLAFCSTLLSIYFHWDSALLVSMIVMLVLFIILMRLSYVKEYTENSDGVDISNHE